MPSLFHSPLVFVAFAVEGREALALLGGHPNVAKVWSFSADGLDTVGGAACNMLQSCDRQSDAGCGFFWRRPCVGC